MIEDKARRLQRAADLRRERVWACVWPLIRHLGPGDVITVDEDGYPVLRLVWESA
jgi:hypothetical protein